MDLYAETVLDHYRHPRKKQPLAVPTVRHEEKNMSCGDAQTVDLVIDHGVIAAVGWTGDGCAISQAAMSLLSEKLTDMPVSDAQKLDQKDILDLLGVPVGPRRTKCALLCLHTLKNALNAYEGKALASWVETVATQE